MRNNPAMVHRIAVLALDQVVGLDLGTARPGLRRRPGRRRPALYQVARLHRRAAGRSACAAGFAVHPDHDLTLTETADTVVVPGIHDGSALTDGDRRPGGRRRAATHTPAAPG